VEGQVRRILSGFCPVLLVACRTNGFWRRLVLAHEAQDVHQAVDAPEVSADPPIAIKAIFERDLLGFVAQIRFRPLRRTNFAKSIEAGSTMRCRKPFGSRCSE